MNNKSKILILTVVVLILISGCNNQQYSDQHECEVSGLEIGDIVGIDTGLSSGELKVTVTSAMLVSDASKLPSKEFFFEQYGHYVSHDGLLIEGGYLIVLEVDVESLNAEVKLDLDNDNPHLFRADSLFTLVDISEKQKENYVYQYMDYYSLMNSTNTHPFAFELEPGDTISFEIGFFIGNKKDGSRRALSNLYACTSSGSAGSDFVALNLEEIPYD